MDALQPLAAFQALCITLAAAVVIDARREADLWRYGLWGVAILLAALGVFAAPIGAAWPASLALMQDLGGSAIPWFVVAVGIYFALRPRWKKPVLTTVEESGPSVEPYDDAKLRSEVAALEKTVRAVIEDYQRMLGIEAKFSEMLDGVRADLAKIKAAQAESRPLDERFASAISDMSERLRAAEIVTAMVQADKRRERAKAVVTRGRPPLHRPGRLQSPQHHNNWRNISIVETDLTQFEHGRPAFDRIKNEITAKVLADAKYLQFSDDDAKAYQSAEDKRRYIIDDMYYDALWKIIEEIANGRR